MRRINNLLFRLFLIIFLVFGLSLTLINCGGNETPPLDPDPDELKPLIDLDEYDAYYISTSFGEDSSTTININYHTKNTKTSVEYTTAEDESFEQAKTVYGKCFVFEPEDTEWQPYPHSPGWGWSGSIEPNMVVHVSWNRG